VNAAGHWQFQIAVTPDFLRLFTQFRNVHRMNHNLIVGTEPIRRSRFGFVTLRGRDWKLGLTGEA
jgi:hypothetical protein